MDKTIRCKNRNAISGDTYAEAGLIRSKQRGGFITGEAVKLAAELGHPAALILIPEAEQVDWAKWVERKSLLERVETLMGKPFIVRFVADCAERVLPVFEAAYPDDGRPRLVITAARAWAERPTEELRMAARSAAGNAWAAYSVAISGAAVAAAYSAAAASSAAASAAASASRAAAGFAAYAANWAWMAASAAAAADVEEYEWQRARLADYLLEKDVKKI